MKVGVSVKFDAAHHLPEYKGKCVNMHGHTWHVEVEVSGEIDGITGMVVDLARLKQDVNILIEGLDHQNLNRLFYQPTCEHIAQWISDHLVAKYNVQRVKVREGEGGWAEI